MKSAKGIILAAGRGSRMGANTASQPKCLVRLAGRRLLDWQLEAMAKANVKDVVVIGGYRADQLRLLGCKVVENPKWTGTNMVRSLLCAREILLAHASIVLYSDIVLHPEWLKLLVRSEHAIAITYDRCWAQLWRERFFDPLEDAETFRVDGLWLADIGRRAADIEAIQGQFMGALRFAPAGWKAAELALSSMDQAEVDRIDMTSLLRRLLADGVGIAAIPVDGRWCEVDRQKDVDVYEAAIASADHGDRRWFHDWR